MIHAVVVVVVVAVTVVVIRGSAAAHGESSGILGLCEKKIAERGKNNGIIGDVSAGEMKKGMNQSMGKARNDENGTKETAAPQRPSVGHF